MVKSFEIAREEMIEEYSLPSDFFKEESLKINTPCKDFLSYIGKSLEITRAMEKLEEFEKIQQFLREVNKEFGLDNVVPIKEKKHINIYTKEQL